MLLLAVIGAAIAVVRSPAARQRVESVAAELRTQPDVASVAAFYTAHDTAMVARDRRLVTPLVACPPGDAEQNTLGVIDLKTNYIEHLRVVADRLVNLGKVIGKGRLIAGTDCGFDTFIRWSQVDPDVAWLKLKSLSEGADLASREL